LGMAKIILGNIHALFSDKHLIVCF